MELFASVLLAVQVLTSLSIIVLVLLQQGKGADMGSSFGGGSAGSLFGASGAANFLSRMTKWVAIVFFASTMGLAWVAHHPTGSILDGGVMQGFERDESGMPMGSEVPGGQIPGAVDTVPEPAVVPQDATPAVPDVPSVPGGDSMQAPDVPAVAPENTASGTPAVPDVPSANTAPDTTTQNN